MCSESRRSHSTNYEENARIDDLSRQLHQRNEFCDDSLSDLLLSFVSSESLDETIAPLDGNHSQFACDQHSAANNSSLEATFLSPSFEIMLDESNTYSSNENSFVEKIDWIDKRSDKGSDHKSSNRRSLPTRAFFLDSLENSAHETKSALLVKPNDETLHGFKSKDSLGENYLDVQDQSLDLFDGPNQKCPSMRSILSVGPSDVEKCFPTSSPHLHERLMNSNPSLSSRNVTGDGSSILSVKPSKSSPMLTNGKSFHRRRRSSYRGTLDGWILKKHCRSDSAVMSHRSCKSGLFTVQESPRPGLVPNSSSAPVGKSRCDANVEPTDIHFQSQTSLSSAEISSDGHVFSPNRAHSEALLSGPLCTSTPLNKELLATPPTKRLSKNATTAHHILSPLNRLSPNLSSPLPDTPPPSTSKGMLPSCKEDERSSSNLVSKKLSPLFIREKGGLENSSKLTQHSREVAKIFSSPTFLQRYDEVKLSDTEHLRPGMVIRRKDERNLLHGFDCKCCVGYYNALGMSTQQKRDRINEVSRHRGIVAEPDTPEHYWEVRMADRDEQRRRGQIAESDSPIGLKTRYASYNTDTNIKRKLFR
uniref:DNA endonuclease activator Ctp1 C-terminal domain-containing protein n=1 Tax=Parascaris univalens TaxID=6257 RepID=A0A915A7W0_PARUN